VAERKHDVSIMTWARAEAAYITEWLLYHQAIGFDHVYLYCNDDDPAALYTQVLPFCHGATPFVTFHHFPFPGQHFYMMMHGLAHHKDATQWLAFLNVNEFLALPELGNIKEYLRLRPAHWDAILFNMSFFGDNGHTGRDGYTGRPPGGVLTNYTRREDRLRETTRTITRTVKIDLTRLTHKLPFWQTWLGVFGPAFGAVNVLGETVDRPGSAAATHPRSAQIQARMRSIGFVNHYEIRSADDLPRCLRCDTQEEFSDRRDWKHLADPGRMDATVKSLNAIEDTYLADVWRRLTRDSRAGQIVTVPQLPNVALGKRADQSSISQYSRGATTADDAAGAINGSITGQAQCHTDLEMRPWWMVDLGEPHLIYEIRVFNRVDQPAYRERLGAVRIEIAEATGVWVSIHEHDAGRPIGGADGAPLIVRLASPCIAGRLRVMALGETCLHLDQVQVHGVPAADTAGAIATPALSDHRQSTALAADQPDLVSSPEPSSPAPLSHPAPPPGADVARVAASSGRAVGRITLAELLKLAQREPAIQDDFLYVALLAPAGRYTRRPPSCLDVADAVSLTRVLATEYTGRQEQTYPATFHVALRDATVCGQGSVVSAGGALLMDSCWEFFSTGHPPPGLVRTANGRYRLEQRPSRHIERPSLLVKRPFWRNYAHWLVDGASLLAQLPAMTLPADCQIVVGAHDDPAMRAIVQETLATLAPGRLVIEQPDEEAWTFSALHYVSPQRIPPLTTQPGAIAQLHARVPSGLYALPARRRLYVARGGELGCVLVNAEQVSEVCRQLGFEVISLERHSLREQAALFRSAACVIGVKGAVLANIAFCTSAARLFVLSPADCPDPIFWDLAGQRGIVYGEMFGPIVPVHERQSPHGFTIDIQRLTGNLAAFCEPLEHLGGNPGANVVV
jgi:capsular polysaccharide biosynthesis protein